MEQIELIPEIKRLCLEGRYDEAIVMTNDIKNKDIAIKARLLCMEHEESNRIDG